MTVSGERADRDPGQLRPHQMVEKQYLLRDWE